jgi:hypothetical protein
LTHPNVVMFVGLTLSLSLAACQSCRDDGDWEPPRGQPIVPPLQFACELHTDTDTMTRSFAVDSLSIPASNATGLNVDGFISTTTQDIGGCRKVDGPVLGGIDNALAEIASSLDARSAADEGVALERSVLDSTTTMRVTVHHWNGTSTDPCVGVDLSSASNPTLRASAPLQDGKIKTLYFGGELVLDVRTESSVDGGGTGGCDAGCTESVVPVVVRGVRSQIVFDSAMSAMIVAASMANADSTIFGGYVVYSGSSPSALEPMLETMLTQTASSLAHDMLETMPQFLDLDVAPDFGLFACIPMGPDMANPNGFSVGVVVTGHAINP